MILSVSTLIGVIIASASTGVVVGIAGKKIFENPYQDCVLASNNFIIDVSPCCFCDLEAPPMEISQSSGEFKNAAGATVEGSKTAGEAKWNNFLKLHNQ